MKLISSAAGLALLVSGTSAIAKDSQADTRPLLPNEKSVQSLPTTKLSRFALNAIDESDEIADVVVFYQPSYARREGEYSLYNRIEGLMQKVNETYANHGHANYKLLIKDIVPIESVSDEVPARDKLDEDGNIIVDGSEYLASIAILNEGNPEYEIYQNKWKADFAVYLREYRTEDGNLRGSAGIGGELSTTLDAGADSETEITLAHEIGHNLGMNHEDAEAFVGPDYARAWMCGGNKTIMYSASAIGERISYYSDPSITNNDEVCGTETANNARILRENFVASTNRRVGVESLGNVSFTETTLTGDETNGVTFTLSRTGDISEAASVKVFAVNGEAKWGEDFTDAFILADFAENESSTTVTYPMLNDGKSEESKALQFTLKYPYKLSLGENYIANVTLVDGEIDGEAGMFSISGSDNIEEGGTGTFTVTRVDGVGEVILDVNVTSDNAYVSNDYIEPVKKLVFSSGETEKTFSITSIDDREYDKVKTLSVAISSSDDSATFEPASIDMTITDNDESEYGSFTLDSALESVSEDVGTFIVTVSRTGQSAAIDLTLTSQVKDKTAEQTVSFAEGEMSKDVTISVLDNSTDEDNYEIVLSLSSATVYQVDANSISVTVVDDDTTETTNPAPTPTSPSGESGGGSMGWSLLLLSFIVLFSRMRPRKMH